MEELTMEATLEAPEVVVDVEKQQLRARLLKIKARIKALAEDQKKVKTLLRGDHRTIKERGAKMDAPWLQEECYNRAMQLTALLNLYNTMRKKEYRHKTTKYSAAQYERIYNDLFFQFKD
jgi:hypothetical protein